MEQVTKTKVRNHTPYITPKAIRYKDNHVYNSNFFYIECLNDLFYYYSLNSFGYMTSIHNMFSCSDLFLCIYKPNCVNLVFHKDHVYSD
jgi:hypothetical protein